MSMRKLCSMVNAASNIYKITFNRHCVVFTIFTYFFTSKTAMPEPEFPRTLKDFGYEFDEGGKLRKLDSTTGLLTNEGFDFNVTDDPQYNQKRYEALGEIINQYVYDLLAKEGLKRFPVPKEGSTSLDLRSFIFASNDALDNEKLIVLIHGSGVVRAGQWARRLIINDNLQSGTQLPYIRRARELGYGVLVLNTNDNYRTIKGKQKEIKGSEDPCRHMETVWTDYIQQSKAKHIALIAHSYGGVCAVKFGMNHVEDFKERIFAVALTDSVHTMPSKGSEHIIKVARNWVSSGKPLDTPKHSLNGDVQRVSAGVAVHEMTSWSCLESLFKFIEDRYHHVTDRSDL